MAAEALVSSGGFAPPGKVPITLETIRITPLRDAIRGLPTPFGREMEVRYFADPAARWAFYRERELQDERRVREHQRQLAAEEWPFEYPTYRRDP